MNFYPFHIGDYASATRHLSWDEDMAYRRMLDAYYTREAPLPADRKAVYRLVGANDKRKRDAVDAVLVEFFVESEAGWSNARCDEEIASAAEKAVERSAKRDNEAERQRRHRERRKELFDLLRGHGVVPSYDTPTSTLEEMALSRLGNAPVTRDSPSPETVTQRLTNPNPNPNPNPNDRGDRLTRDPDADLEARLREAAGWQSHPNPKLAVTGPIVALLEAGADLEMDVLPVISALAPKVRTPSWAYFVNPIAEARDNRINAATVVSLPTSSARSPSHAAHRKPSRDETFAAIDRRIDELREAERRATGGGAGYPEDPAEGAA